jgi:hypothetical protein
MQIRCYSCHTPFAISRDAVRAALDQIHEQGLSHYNAQCPRCRKVNRISPEQLQRAAPDWVPPEEQEPAAEEE